MKRIQLFEFEDFAWFPSWIRSSMTNLIKVLHKLMGTKEVLSEIITETHQPNHLIGSWIWFRI